MDHTVVAAIASAIHHHNETTGPQTPQAAPQAVSLNVWGLHGRQSIMQMRGLVQRRVLSR